MNRQIGPVDIRSAISPAIRDLEQAAYSKVKGQLGPLVLHMRIEARILVCLQPVS